MNRYNRTSNGDLKLEFATPSVDEYYVDTNDEIPLSKVSNDEKRDEQDDYLSVQAGNKRYSNDNTYNVSPSKMSLMAKPLFNIAMSSFFTIALLLVYMYADEKSIDFQIIGLKIPSLVSLILTIDIIFLTGGISMAVAEYKWVRLRNGTELTTIDVYDSCTRGLSGFLTAIKALHFDWILLLAMVFYLGLLVVGPASQEILVPVVNSFTDSGADIRFYHFPANYTNDRNGLQSSGMAAKLNGLATNGYITTSSFVQAATNISGHPIFICPSNASYCEFKNITYISTSMTCNNITENDTAIVNRDKLSRYNIVLKEFFTYANISYGNRKFPEFLYATEMFNRTYYDLANFTAPTNALNITETLTSETEYEPFYRPYVGEQVFVMAHNKNNMYESYANNYTEIAFKKCHFNSSLNTSTWRTSEGQLSKVGDDSSVPITFDFDNVIGNNVALNALGKNFTNDVMVNAYTMQQALLKELIEPEYYTMYDYLRNWRTTFGLKVPPTNPFEEFMKDALPQFDYAFFQAPYISEFYESITNTPTEGLAYYTMKPHYSVRKVACYTLSLCLFLPSIWWIIVWMISIKKSDGIARGNSQIVLLATGMTPLAEHNMHSFCNMDAENAFKKAKKIRIRVGTFTGNGDNRVAFGMEGEDGVSPLK